GLAWRSSYLTRFVRARLCALGPLAIWRSGRVWQHDDAVQHDDGPGIRGICRLQLAMERARCRLGSCLQVSLGSGCIGIVDDIQARRLRHTARSRRICRRPFLPYAVLGAAVGRFNFGDLSTGTFVGKDNAFDVGFVAGLGVDWAVAPGVFLRAEWE